MAVQTIFNNTDDFKSVMPFIHKNYKWEGLAVICEQIAKQRVIPFVGDAVYTHCKTAQHDPASLGGLQAQYELLLIHMREVIAYYAYALIHDLGNVSVSEMGVQQSYSSEGSSSPASNWAKFDSQRETLNYADSSMDRMLLDMEKQMAENDFYADWKSSQAFIDLTGLFVYHTKHISDIIDRASLRLLHSIRASIRYIQERDIRPVLGATLYDGLISAIQAQSAAAPLTAAQQSLLKMVRDYLTRKGLSEGLPMTRITFEMGGLMVASYDGPASQAFKSATDAQVRHVVERLNSQTEATMTNLQRFLQENADDYPDYTAPDLTGPDGSTQYGQRVTRFGGSVRL